MTEPVRCGDDDVMAFMDAAFRHGRESTEAEAALKPIVQRLADFIDQECLRHVYEDLYGREAPPIVEAK